MITVKTLLDYQGGPLCPPLLVPCTVGTAFAWRSAIICFGARLFRIRVDDARSASMCFDFGGPKKIPKGPRTQITGF